MNGIIFNQQNNFRLVATNWGEARPIDIVKLLDSVILDFYSSLDRAKIPVKPVIVASAYSKVPAGTTPEIIKMDAFDLIFLHTKDLLWSQYSYQFAHELCHHVIGSDFLGKNDQFGWFEESFCELASIYTLDKMSSTWLLRPPYPNWRAYSLALKSYVDEILSKPENNVGDNFAGWLAAKIPELAADRYKRMENRIVAIHLFKAFKQDPTLWQTIQYIKDVKVTREMQWTDFFCSWKGLLASDLKEKFEIVEHILFGKLVCLKQVVIEG